MSYIQPLQRPKLSPYNNFQCRNTPSMKYHHNPSSSFSGEASGWTQPLHYLFISCTVCKEYIKLKQNGLWNEDAIVPKRQS
jgi:hypothetical protein